MDAGVSTLAMEGRQVLKTWYAAWAAAGMAACCAGPLGSDVFSGRAYAQAPAASGSAAGSPQRTWADKITAPLAKAGDAIKKMTASEPSPPSEPPFNPDATTPELYVAMAQMSQRSGNVPNARMLYQKSLEKNPHHLEALLGAARMEDREGNLEVATSLYLRAVRAYPQHATVLNDLGLCLARRGDLAGARRALDDAIRVAPQKPLYRNNMAKVLVEMNELDAATNHLSAVYPPAVANYNMAVFLLERGRQDEANDYLQSALALDPNLTPAQQLLAQQTNQSPTPANQTAQGQQHHVQPTPEQSGDTILPTPQVVATIPWRAPGMVEQPALLPPTN